MSVEGKQVVDIGDLIVETCESIVPLLQMQSEDCCTAARISTSIEKRHYIVRWRFANWWNRNRMAEVSDVVMSMFGASKTINRCVTNEPLKQLRRCQTIYKPIN